MLLTTRTHSQTQAINSLLRNWGEGLILQAQEDDGDFMFMVNEQVVFMDLKKFLNYCNNFLGCPYVAIRFLHTMTVYSASPKTQELLSKLYAKN